MKLNETWKHWKQELFLHLTATEKDGKTDKVKTSILLISIDKRGREVYNTLTFASEGDELKFKTVVEQFDNTASQERTSPFYVTSSFHESKRAVKLLSRK